MKKIFFALLTLFATNISLAQVGRAFKKGDVNLSIGVGAVREFKYNEYYYNDYFGDHNNNDDYYRDPVKHFQLGIAVGNHIELGFNYLVDHKLRYLSSADEIAALNNGYQYVGTLSGQYYSYNYDYNIGYYNYNMLNSAYLYSYSLSTRITYFAPSFAVHIGKRRIFDHYFKIALPLTFVKYEYSNVFVGDSVQVVNRASFINTISSGIRYFSSPLILNYGVKIFLTK